MKSKILFFVIFSTCFLGCSTKEHHKKVEYLRWVGDSVFRSDIDSETFSACHGDENIYQYFNLSQGPEYLNEKPALEVSFKNAFKPVVGKNQNGMIRIRFVVNCEGHAGRFRLLQSDFNYQETIFDKAITMQLLEITKSIRDWQVFYKNEKPIDYYQYLIFKIEDGQIKEILP